ncbi:MAG: substrate-binding domain-containing protein [Verrucomicrobia bacterium]|nr:substrate-binding domain-containing protein [Verrucomicrobiota bacterium]
MKKAASLILSASIVLLFVFGGGNGAFAQAQNQGTIVFIPKSTSATFYLFLVKGAKDRAQELGYKIDYQGPATETEIASQVDLVRNIARSRPAGILLAALDSKALIPPVQEAVNNGVPVVMVDSGIDSDVPQASVISDNYDGGLKAGMEMARILGEKGLVANLGIQAGSVSSKRSTAFNDAIAKFPNMKVLPIQWTNADAATSMNIASDLLNGNPGIAGVFSACAPTAVGACQAIKAKGLENKVKVVTFDPSPEVLPLFESGAIQAIIAQDPYQMGYQGVGYIDQARKKVPIQNKRVELPPVLITPENYHSDAVQKLLQTPGKF